VDVTTIKLADAAESHVINVASVDRFQIYDLTIDGNRANQAVDGGVHGIRVFAGSYLHFARLRVKECRYYGIGIQKDVDTSTTLSVFEHLQIHDNGRSTDGAGDGFDVKLCERCTFKDIWTYDNEQRGLDVRGRQLTYENIWAWNNGANGISLRVIGDPASDENFISAVNCFSFSNDAEGFIILCNEAPIVGNTAKFKLVNCWAWENTLQGFKVDGDTMTTEFVACTARDNVAQGFLVQDTTKQTKFIGCDATGNTTGFDCLSTSAGSECIAIGCTASGNTSTNQVYFAYSFSQWIGGTIDASGKTRGITVAADAHACGRFRRGRHEATCLRLHRRDGWRRQAERFRHAHRTAKQHQSF
jgi:hypothetical protein